MAPTQGLLVQRLAAELRCSALFAQCLVNRGYSDPAAINAFLDPRLKNLSDPFLLPDMDRAVDRLFHAREHAEALVIFGDYDVDGVTATALLTEVLQRLGWKLHTYLPNRFDEGYGLSQQGVENCLRQFPVKLLLAVDCGSTAVKAIDWLRRQSVDVIVLDHHQLSDPAPDAAALVNPQRESSEGQGFRELCSVGLAFKLAHALLKRGRQIGLAGAAEFDLRRFLDLVALGTIADLVPLIRENRILVSAGLARLNTTGRLGLQALKVAARINGSIGVYEVGFQLAPRLNAAGRLETASKALRLLLSEASAEAGALAAELDAQNRERQQIERAIAEDVIGALRAKFDSARDYVIVEGQLLWHVGVVGIVASRVLREFYRPTIILGGDGTEWRGSGRSIEGFDLAAALRSCDDLLLRHGGHAMAAGLSMQPEKLDLLRDRLNALARGSLNRDRLQPELKIDAEVGLPELTLENIKELQKIEPFGQGNPAIQLVARKLKHQRAPQLLGKEKQHLKLWVEGETTVLEAVWWNHAGKSVPQDGFDLAFIPEINSFNGRESVQLRVLDWRPA